MSIRTKRPRSPGEWSAQPPPIADACWYMACGRCTRPSCAFSHDSYRALLAAFDSQRPFSDNAATRQHWARLDHFAPRFGETAPGRWTAVLPVPLMNKVHRAFSMADFKPTMLAAMGLPEDSQSAASPISVLADEKDCDYSKKLWGSVLLQGSRDEVERGREAFIALMECNFYRTADPRALKDIRHGVQQLRWQTEAVSSNRSSSSSSSSGSSSSGTQLSPLSPAAAPVTRTDGQDRAPELVSPSPRHSSTPSNYPCVALLTHGSCPQARLNCTLLHDSYPALVARFADPAPTSQHLRQLDLVTARFQPKLAQLSSSSTSHPVYVVSLPLPSVREFSAQLMGKACLHARFVVLHCALEQCRFTHQHVSKLEQQRIEPDGLVGRSWLAVQGEGSAHSVDRLLECVFSLHDEIRGKKFFHTEDVVKALEWRLSSWESDRKRTQLADGEFFAFKARGIAFRALRGRSYTKPSSPGASASLSSSSLTSAAGYAHGPPSPASIGADAASPASTSSSTSVPVPVSLSAASAASLQLSPTLKASPAAMDTSDTVSPSVPLPLTAACAAPAALVLPPAPPTAATTALRLAMQLSDMHAVGSTVTHQAMDALFDDHCSAASADCIPFIRLLPSAQFACLPLPLDAASRALLVCEPFDGLPICADIEAETGVDVYVPPLPAELAGDGDSSGDRLCNVQFNVMAVSERSSQQLEDAVSRVMMRWVAVEQHINKHRAADNVNANGVH